MIKESIFYLQYIDFFLFFPFIVLNFFANAFRSSHVSYKIRALKIHILRDRHLFRRILDIPSTVIQQRVLFSEEGTSRSSARSQSAN